MTWHGESCVRFEGKECAVLVDPFASGSGLKLPRSKVDIVAASSEDMAPEDVSGEPFIVDVPGEYEKQGAFVYGLPWKQQKSGKSVVLFRINLEDISIAHLGSLDRPLTPEALETLEGVDVLCLPAGNDVLSAKDAAEVVNQIEPRIVVPLGKKPEALLKEIGAKAETVDKLKLTKKDLPADKRLVYLLERT